MFCLIDVCNFTGYCRTEDKMLEQYFCITFEGRPSLLKHFKLFTKLLCLNMHFIPACAVPTTMGVDFEILVFLHSSNIYTNRCSKI